MCMDNNMRKELCINTLKAAAGRFPIRGAILHSVTLLDRAENFSGFHSALFLTFSCQVHNHWKAVPDANTSIAQLYDYAFAIQIFLIFTGQRSTRVIRIRQSIHIS